MMHIEQLLKPLPFKKAKDVPGVKKEKTPDGQRRFAVMDYIAQSGKPMPNLSYAASANKLTEVDSDYVWQIYKGYLMEQERSKIVVGGSPQTLKRPGEPGAPESYHEYMHQTGREYRPILYGEVLSPAEREYQVQTYTEYYLWEHNNPDLSAWGEQHWLDYMIDLHLQGHHSFPIIRYGKIWTGEEYWRYLQETGDVRHPEAQEGKSSQITSERTTPASPSFVETNFHPSQEQTARAATIVRGQETQLEHELKTAEIEEIAQIIHRDLPTDDGRPGRIEPVRKVETSYRQDGTTICSTRVGLAVTYSESTQTGQTVDNKLIVGVGYFGARSQFDPKTWDAFSDEDLKKGVKGYYVERSYTDEETGKPISRLVAVPLAYKDAQLTFFDHVYNNEKAFARMKKLSVRQIRRNQTPFLEA